MNSLGLVFTLAGVLGALASIFLYIRWLIDQRRRIPSVSRMQDALKSQLKGQLALLIRKRKYIPGVYADVEACKATARLFVHPRKMLHLTVRSIRRLDPSLYNNLARRLGVPTLDPLVPEDWESSISLESIGDECERIKAHLEANKARLHTSNDRASWEEVVAKAPEGKRWRYSHTGEQLLDLGLGLRMRIDWLIEELDQASSRLLLITTRAGRGKTSFVCNLIDTFILKWKIPAVFLTELDFRMMGVGTFWST